MPDDAPHDDAHRWPPIAVAGLIAAVWLVAIGWRVRRSLSLVLDPDQDKFCPAIIPAPPECNPEWHTSLAATSAGAILLAYGLVVLAVLWTRQRTYAAVAYVIVALALLVLVGAISFELVDDPNRYFWSPR